MVLVVAVVLGVASTAFLAFTPPASSQADPLAQARDRLARAQSDAADAQARYDQAVTERDQSQSQMADLEQNIATTRAQEVAVRGEIANRAVALYKNSEDSSGLGVLDGPNPMDSSRKKKFTEAADKFYGQKVQELHDTADKQQQAHEQLQAKRKELDDRVPQLEQDKADTAEKLARATRGVEIVGKLGPLRAAGDPIMGPTVLTGAEMASWVRSSSNSPKLSGGMSVDLIAQMYVDEGNAEGVRGDVAFAQASIETGGFSAGGSDNNFSGLGACDGCGGQNRFPTALDGIRAQIQLLKAYAGGGPLMNPPSPYWWGPDPVTATQKYNSFGGTGSAPTWRQMGGGKWASDRGYADKVLGTYDKMIGSAEGS